MDVKKCENIYTSCSANCYPHCMVTNFIDNPIVFASNNSLILYDLTRHRVIYQVSKHSQPINSVRWIRNTRSIITSSRDMSIIIWELNDEKNVIKSKFLLKNGHKDSIIISDSIIFDKDYYSVSSSNDKSWCLWSNDQLILNENLNYFIFDIRIIDKIAESNDNNGLFILMGGSNDSIDIKHYNLSERKLTKLITLRGHTDWIKSIDYIHFDGKFMLSSASQDFLIRLYVIESTESNVNDSNVISEYFSIDNNQTYTVRLESVLAGHDGWINDCKWIVIDHQLYLLSCSTDKSIILWQQMQHDTSMIWYETNRFGEMGENFYGGFISSSMILSNDSKLVIGQSYNGAIQMWKKANEDNCWQQQLSITGHFKEVNDLSWEPNGEYFLSCSNDQTTRLHSKWIHNDHDEESWHEISRPQIHGYDIKCIHWVNRNSFISGSDEKIIRCFMATKSFLQSLKNISDIEIAIDDNNEKLMAECAIIPSLGLSTSAVYDVESIEQKEFQPKILQQPPNEEILMQNTLWSETMKLYGHGYEIFAITTNHSGTLLASACKASSLNYASIFLWDLKTNKKLTELTSHNLTVTQLRFSPGDQYLLSVSRDRTWSLFDAINFKRLSFSEKSTTGVHTRIIWDCAWTPDSRQFLTASRDKTIMQWSLNNATADNDNSQLKIAMIQKQQFDHPITTIDVHMKIFTNGSHQFFLIGVGLENGQLSLHMIEISTNKWINVYNFNDNHHHTSMVNRLRFSPKILMNEKLKTADNDENIVSNSVTAKNDTPIIYLSTCGQDSMVKLFKIYF